MISLPGKLPMFQPHTRPGTGSPAQLPAWREASRLVMNLFVARVSSDDIHSLSQ